MRSASEKQRLVTRALACLASCEWHDYTIDALVSIWRETLKLIWSHCDQLERRFLQRYGDLLQESALPCYPLMADAFDQAERRWLRLLYELEPSVSNAIYYARCLDLERDHAIVRYDLWEEDEINESGFE